MKKNIQWMKAAVLSCSIITATACNDGLDNPVFPTGNNEEPEPQQEFVAQELITPTSQMEKLDRGLVALPLSATATTGNFVSWRLLGTDDARTVFDVVRNGTVIAEGLEVTNYADNSGSRDARYQVIAKVEGRVVEMTSEVTPWTQIYKQLKLDRPATGANGGTYTPNDCSAADVDGDGTYEIIVKWDPSNSKDNSQSGVTDNVILDCYKLDGQKLWRIDLGPNIRAGAHYTQFQVFDYNGDGRAELICKTAPGSLDASGQYVNQAATDENITKRANNSKFANGSGYILSGAEYLTVFDGLTGKAIHTIWYLPNRAGGLNEVGTQPEKAYWGDNYGNRQDRFLAATAYLDGPDQNPSAIFSRGYYTRAFIWAVTFDGQKLHTKWLSDSENRSYLNLYIGDELVPQPRKAYTAIATNGRASGSRTMYGNGNHNLSIADVDGDGKDEIIWGSAALDDDGYMLYSTGFGHGDAIHLADHDPDRPGLEIFQIHEESPYGWHLSDAATGEVLYSATGGADNGRGMAAQLSSTVRGSFFSSSNDRSQRSAVTGKVVSSGSTSLNFRMYWDGSVQDQLLDGNTLDRWNGSSTSRVMTFYNYGNSSTCNSTKKTPNLQADLFGDWREELILWDSSDNSTLNIFTTNIPTTYRVPTLMHDHVYRMGIAWQNSAYNQPPHLGFYLPDFVAK